MITKMGWTAGTIDRRVLAVLLCSVFLCVTPVAVAEPVEISTPEDLRNISDNLSGEYELTDDINLNSTFEPIGNCSSYRNCSRPFQGTLNGTGHTISNLNWTPNPSREDDVGLFAAIGRQGHVHNLRLRNIYVNGTGGTLAILNRGRITEVRVKKANLTGGVGDFVGGIVGESRVNSGLSRRSICPW